MKDVVSFLALGGQAENGKSMYVIEINQKIFVVDTGFRFPEQDKLGVDIIIPKFDYLIENVQTLQSTKNRDELKSSTHSIITFIIMSQAKLRYLHLAEGFAPTFQRWNCSL